ncbi:hypothetical protein [Actinokineospora inagensis]|uniref:hypothetical protein n=1 Tax=Actinokineospora inagensis TaxID=103730 RepID=UPI0003FFE696|nr:hypothetical protein [Actinokineospora inagensis]
MNQTYDPVVESIPLKRLRAGGVRGPAMGTALVLERAVGDPVVVRAGERVPDARTGNYRVAHRVDVANRAVGTTFSSPSADSSFPFQVTVSCGCEIVDPVRVVRDGVRDMAAALQAWLTGQVRAVTMRFEPLRPANAEAAVVEALLRAYVPDGVRLTGFSVQVETSDVAEFLSTQRELRVLEMRRDAMRPVADGGRGEMLAHVMAMTGGDPTPMLDREQDAKEHSTNASLQALRALMGSEKMEEFNTSRISDTVMSEFFPGGNPLLGGKRSGIRDRLERKRKTIDGAGAVVEGESKPTAETPPPTPAAPPKGDKPVAERLAEPAPPEAKPSRVRGVLRSEDG